MIISSNAIRKLILAHALLAMVFLFLLSVLRVPRAAVYIFDLLVCAEFIWSFRGIRGSLKKAGCEWIILFLITLTFYYVLTQLFNAVPLKMILLAYRRTYRFFIFFLVCVVMMHKDHVDKMMGLLLKLQIVNFILSLYQYFVKGLSQDYLGGIFGVEIGVNVYSNVFLCIICAYAILQYLAGKMKMMTMAWVLGSSLLIAALAELKVFFIEIIAIVLLAIILSKFSKRTMTVIICCAAGSVVALALFAQLFPEHMAILTNKELFSAYTTEVTLGYNISRLKAFSQIDQLFFEGNVWRNLFGLGFGNCETGSAFYNVNEGYHYHWFSHQVGFLETGYVGVVLYMLFFLLIFIYATCSKKRDQENGTYYSLTQITSALCGIWFIYNQSLRVEAAYLIFFVLAIPAIIRKDRIEKSAANQL